MFPNDVEARLGALYATFPDFIGYGKINEGVYRTSRKSDIATRRLDLHQWCGGGSVTFTVTNTTSYQLSEYVNAPYPIGTTNMVLTLQVVWQ